ncbi:MAG: rod shape-determining protein RodA [Acidimicrobiia bacterium]|nr:rod shape-determining protein RodA [Acidimicrobiia bacterium]
MLSRSPSTRYRRDPASPLHHIDPILIGCVGFLALVGIVAVYSSTRGPGPTYATSYLFKQFLFISVGVGVMAMLTTIDYRKLHDWAWAFYGSTIVLLVLVLSPVGSQSNGAQSWFSVGPFQMQPAEFAKIALIGVLAFLLSEYRGEIDLRRVLTLLGTAAVPMLLILVQPDLGLTLVLVVIMMAMLLVGGLPTRYILGLSAAGVVGVFLLLNSPVLQDYQRARLTAFINPTDRSTSAVYNIQQSQQAIANGGVTGTGLFDGPQTKLGFVPEQETDFIFTAVAEQFGFLGAGLLLAVYGLLCWRIWRIAHLARDTFGTYLCIGVLAMFAFSAFENVGMAMGIMPVTGIPLLLISAGGSSIITSFAALGMVLNVHMRRFR